MQKEQDHLVANSKVMDSVYKSVDAAQANSLKTYNKVSEIYAKQNNGNNSFSIDSKDYSIDGNTYLETQKNSVGHSINMRTGKSLGVKVTDEKGIGYAVDGQIDLSPFNVIDKNTSVATRARDDFIQTWGTSALQTTFQYKSEIFKQYYRTLGYNLWIGRMIQMGDISYDRIQLVTKQVVNTSLVNKDGNTLITMSSRSTQSNISISVNYSLRRVYAYQQLWNIDYINNIRLSRSNINMQSEFTANSKEVFDMNDDAIGLFGFPDLGIAGLIDHPDLNPVITAPVPLVNGNMPPQALYALLQLIYSLGMESGKGHIKTTTKCRIAIPPFFYNLFTNLWTYVPTIVKDNIFAAYPNLEFVSWPLLDFNENGITNFMMVMFEPEGQTVAFQPFANRYVMLGTKQEFRDLQTKVYRVNVGGAVFVNRDMIYRFDLGNSSPTINSESVDLSEFAVQEPVVFN